MGNRLASAPAAQRPAGVTHAYAAGRSAAHATAGRSAAVRHMQAKPATKNHTTCRLSDKETTQSCFKIERNAQAMLDTRVRRQAARSVGLGFLKSNISLGNNNNVQLEQSFVPQHDVPTFRNDEAFQPIRPIRASGSLVNNDQKQNQKFSQWRFQQHLVQLNSDANSSSLSAQSTQSVDGSDDISSSLPRGPRRGRV